MRAVRAALRDRSAASRLAAAASDVLGEPVRLLARDVRPLMPGAPPWSGALALLVSHDDAWSALVSVEPSLAARITATLLARPTPWVDDSQPVPALVQAALGAFLAAIARRHRAADPSDVPSPLRLVAVGEQARQRFASSVGTTGVAVHATALVGDDAYGVAASVLLREHPTAGEPTFDLRALGSMHAVPMTLPIVAASSTASREDLESVSPGDAWLPGEGWTVRRTPTGWEGDVLLCAPTGELALPAKLHADGRIVLGEGVMQVDADARTTHLDEASAASTDAAPTVADVVAETPVVVRVEVGAVTLTAREWAALKPGDVLLTGTRIAERVVLRVGGVEVAQGELVDVDGELGVRIHARSGQGGAP